MSAYAKKYSAVFFSSEDERFFETRVKEHLPNVCFLDDCLWADPTPPISKSLADCRARTVYIWDRDACPDLPFQLQEDGRARGPTSGVVIQFIRCVLTGRVLLSGDIGIGYEKDNSRISQFVKAVFSVVKPMNCSTLSSINPRTSNIIEEGVTNYIVGPGAKKLSEAGVLLKHMASDVYYRT
jgi:hypothetical protein